MKSAKMIYLCDGSIVSDLKFISNFKFRFDGDWKKICGKQPYAVLSWNTSSLTGHVFTTDDEIPCTKPPTTKTMPFTYSKEKTPNSVGWKGAWAGMRWYVNIGSTKGAGIGSVKVLDSSSPVLVITPGKLTMSSL